VDCVRDQAKGTRVARNPFGGAVGASSAPRVTQTIIGICVVAYVLQKLPGSDVTQNYEFVPFYATSEPWRLLTAAFLHAPSQPFHILFNMYALWLTGPSLERQFGRLRYVLVFLISAIGGSVGYLLLANPTGPSWVTGTVGASGAVFGLFGAFYVVQRRLNRDNGPLVAIIVVNLIFGFMVAHIAWQAHLGGLVTGALCGAVLAYTASQKRPWLQFAGLGAVAVLLGLLLVIKLSTVPAGYLY
jgi:membrane associated rhomboid family serine protease